MTPQTADDAFRLLQELGASAWLVRHHELVVEAGRLLLDGVPAAWLDGVDREVVVLGCALHDVGKVLFPSEQHEPGHEHEGAGRELLGEHGIDERVSRFCVTHAVWSEESTTEDLLVALADKLWKGKRVEALEELLVGRLAGAAGLSYWDVYPAVDAAFERVAEGAGDRLARAG